MQINHSPHFRRIVLLISNDIERVYHLTVIVAAAVLFLLFSMLYFPLSSQAPSNPVESFIRGDSLLETHYDLFGLVLFIGGILFTSYVLADLGPRDQRLDFLTLPANSLEKVAAKWALTGLIFPLAVLLIYWLFVLFTGWMIARSLGLQLVAMPLLDAFPWKWVLAYIGLQPIFLLGAMSFQRFAAVKTILTGAVFLFILLSLFKISALLFIPDLSLSISFLGWSVFDHLPVINSSSPSPGLYQLNALAPDFKLFDLLMLLSPIFLLITILQFKEKEVTR